MKTKDPANAKVSVETIKLKRSDSGQGFICPGCGTNVHSSWIVGHLNQCHSLTGLTTAVRMVVEIDIAKKANDD